MRISKLGYTGQASIVMKVFMLASFSLLAAVSFFSDTYAADSFYRNFDTRYGRPDVQPVCRKVAGIVASGTVPDGSGNVYVTYSYTLQGNDNARWIEYPSRRIDPSGATHYIQEPGSIVSSVMPRQTSGGYTINTCLAYDAPGRADAKIWEQDGRIDLNSDEFANRFAARFGDRIEDYTYIGMNVGQAAGVSNYFGSGWCAQNYSLSGGRLTYGSVASKSMCGSTQGEINNVVSTAFASLNDAGLIRVGRTKEDLLSSSSTIYCSGMPTTAARSGSNGFDLGLEITAQDNCERPAYNIIQSGCDCAGYLTTKRYENGNFIDNKAGIDRLSGKWKNSVINRSAVPSDSFTRATSGRKLPVFYMAAASANTRDGNVIWQLDSSHMCMTRVSSCPSGSPNSYSSQAVFYMTYIFKPGNWEIKGTTQFVGNQNFAEPGVSAPWLHSLTKEGVGSGTIKWAIQRQIDNGAWNDVKTGTQETGKANPVVFLNQRDEYTPTFNDIGKMICERIVFTPKSSSSNDTGNSEPKCVYVGIYPLVQVLGNDLRVGSSGLATVPNSSSGITGVLRQGRGSWGEYGVLAPGGINQFGSQSPNLDNPTNAASWSKLTFANTGVNTEPPCRSTGLGCFDTPSNMGKIPNVAGFFTSGAKGFNLLRISGAATTGNLGNVNNINQSLVAIVSGDMTIDKDITYSNGTMQDGKEIPQLVIIADNINITSDVKQVDAWLIARNGTVNTCSGVAQSSLRLTGPCSSALRINGPIMSSKLALNRVAFNRDKPNEGAETLNLRGDAYIWANRLARQNGKWQTMHTTELPPRY